MVRCLHFKIVNEPISRSLRILLLPLLLHLWLLLGACRGSCDGTTTTLRTELEDLEVMKSRLLIDLPENPGGPRRLMYVENRNGSNPLLQPEQWALGISGPLVTSGPVSLRGILAQLYNPLAHGAGSDVFADAAGLALNIDLDVAGRRGLQLRVIPGHWDLIGVYKKRVGAQLGSVITLPFGRRTECTVVGLLSAPPDQLEDQQAWYAEDPLFPGGLISHLAGSLTVELDPLRLRLVAAASAGRLVGPRTFATLQLHRKAPPADLDLLLGYCSPRYFTPEGDCGDLQWLAAARVERRFGPLNFTAGWRKELPPLSPFPEAFLESRDQLSTGIEITRKTASGRSWSMEGDAELEREWSPVGEKTDRCSLDAGSTLDWSVWSFTVGMKEEWGGDGERFRDARLVVGCDPSWGEARVEAGYRLNPLAGFHLAAALEAVWEGRRIFIQLETEDVLPRPASGDGRPAEDWLQLFSLRVGWEAKSRR